MQVDLVKKAEKRFCSTFLRVLVACVLGGLLTFFRVARFYDEAAHLIEKTPLSGFLGGAALLLAIYIVIEIFLLTAYASQAAGSVSLQKNTAVGFTLLVAAVCFLFQAVFDLVRVISTAARQLEEASAMLSAGEELESRFAVMLLQKNGILLIVCVLCFISAVSLGLDGMGMISGSFSAPFLIRLALPLWGGVTLLYTMTTYPGIVSMQSDISKIACCIFALLFLLYSSQRLCSPGVIPQSGIGNFFCLVYFPLMCIIALPYGALYLLSIRDSVQNMPYLAFCGLLLFGAITMLQYMVQTLVQIEKKRKKRALVQLEKKAEENFWSDFPLTVPIEHEEIDFILPPQE